MPARKTMSLEGAPQSVVTGRPLIRGNLTEYSHAGTLTSSPPHGPGSRRRTPSASNRCLPGLLLGAPLSRPGIAAPAIANGSPADGRAGPLSGLRGAFPGFADRWSAAGGVLDPVGVAEEVGCHSAVDGGES